MKGDDYVGYIAQSDEIISNTTKRLNDILDSPMTQFLQLGQPVLVTYLNASDLTSTTTNGTGTIDALLGKNSPLRYNKIEGLPVYGMLRNFLVDLQDNDGLYDMGMELDELTVPPNTIIPTPYDYVIYKFGERNERVVLFQVTQIKKASLKSHSFEQFSVKLRDIDSFGDISLLEEQVVKTFTARMENIGTNEKCILESEQYKYSNRISKLIKSICESYVDMFYSSKYRALVFNGELEQGYISYDPWLTHFCITNRIFEDAGSFVVLANLDTDEDSKSKYNKTFYHALEMKSTSKLREMLFTPTNFSKYTTNPFAYYGKDVAFKIDIYEETDIQYPRNVYTDFNFINNIVSGKGESITFSIIENLIVRYFMSDTLINKISESELYELENLSLEHDCFNFRVIPMLIYVLATYNRDVMKAYA